MGAEGAGGCERWIARAGGLSVVQNLAQINPARAVKSETRRQEECGTASATATQPGSHQLVGPGSSLEQFQVVDQSPAAGFEKAPPQ